MDGISISESLRIDYVKMIIEHYIFETNQHSDYYYYYNYNYIIAVMNINKTNDMHKITIIPRKLHILFTTSSSQLLLQLR